MSKSIIGLMIFALMFNQSCSPRPEEKAIGDFVQIRGDIKTDLSFDLVDLKLNSELKGKDSLNILLQESKASDIDLYINDMKSKIQQWTADGDHLRPHFENLIKEYKATIDRIRRYQKDPDGIVLREYTVTYSINNPLLNGAKQEIVKRMYLSSDGTKVYGVLEN